MVSHDSHTSVAVPDMCYPTSLDPRELSSTNILKDMKQAV